MDFQKKLQMPRVLFGAGMLVAFIGFLLPMTKINKSYFDDKQAQYEAESAQYDAVAQRQAQQADAEKIANGETKLYATFKAASDKAEAKSLKMAAKAEKIAAKIDSIVVNEANSEKADAILSVAEAKAEKILADAVAKCETLVPGFAKMRDDPTVYEYSDDPAIENKVENIMYAAEEKAESIIASAEAIASNLTDGAKTVNICTTGVIMNKAGIAYIPTYLWAVCLACLAGVVVYVLTHAIVFDYLCWLIGCAFGIASVVVTSAEFGMNVFVYSGFGAYVVFIGMTVALVGLVLASISEKK